MKSIFSNLFFWFAILVIFLVIILRDSDLDKDIQSKYLKQKMRLTDVNFSEMDQGFEHARMYADVVDMDDAQNNMIATRVRTLFFDKKVATRAGELTASYAVKSPFEVKFWGDVKVRNTDRERLRTEELRYILSRKELYTNTPVTMWKDDMVITGKDLRYNSQTKSGRLDKDILIRIWKAASSSITPTATAPVSGSNAPSWHKSGTIAPVYRINTSSTNATSASQTNEPSLARIPGRPASHSIIPDSDDSSASPAELLSSEDDNDDNENDDNDEDE